MLLLKKKATSPVSSAVQTHTYRKRTPTGSDKQGIRLCEAVPVAQNGRLFGMQIIESHEVPPQCREIVSAVFAYPGVRAGEQNSPGTVSV